MNPLARATGLPLYRTAWSGRAPEALEEAPPLSAWAWRRFVRRDPGRSLAQPPALWALHPLPGDDPIWIPFAREDIIDAARRAGTLFSQAGIVSSDIVLSVAPEGPWLGNALPYLISGTEGLVPGRLPPLPEVLPLSVLTVSFKADLTLFPFTRVPSVVVGAAAEVMAIMAAGRGAGAAPLRSRLLLLTGPATDHAAVSDLADTCVDLLYLPGAFAPFGGRPGERGVWLPRDVVLGELIPDAEWGRAVADPSYHPRVLPLTAAVGLSGELVVSVDNAALPIVRFRTQERVRVAEVEATRGVRVERVAPIAAAGVDGARPFRGQTRPRGV